MSEIRTFSSFPQFLHWLSVAVRSPKNSPFEMEHTLWSFYMSNLIYDLRDWCFYEQYYLLPISFITNRWLNSSDYWGVSGNNRRNIYMFLRRYASPVILWLPSLVDAFVACSSFALAVAFKHSGLSAEHYSLITINQTVLIIKSLHIFRRRVHICIYIYWCGKSEIDSWWVDFPVVITKRS